MFFEAVSKGIKYEIVVNEDRESYHIEMKPQGKEELICYKILKEDYQELDNAISLLFKKSSYLIDVVHGDKECTVYTRGSHRTIQVINDEIMLHESLKNGRQRGDSQGLVAGMPGKIVKVLVEEGQSVGPDEPLLIMEAMKMENEMRASQEVKIKKIFVKEGDNVEVGAELIAFQTEAT